MSGYGEDFRGVLKQEAEQLLVRMGKDPTKALEEDLAKILSQLESFQTELELQQHELTRSAEALENSNEKYRNLFEKAPVGYFIIDLNTVVLEANRTAAELLGISLDELIRKPFSSFISQEHQMVFYKFRKDARNELSSRTFEVELERANGEPFWVNVTVVPMTFRDKAAPSCIMVISDISEIKNMTNVLSERENLLLDIADSVPVLMWLTDSNGDCIYFNRAWYEFTGRTFEQEHAKGWMNDIHKMDFNDFFRAFREALAKKQRFECEFRLKNKSGSYRWGLFCGEPHFSQDGIFEGLIGNFMDITKRKNMENERRDTEIKIMAQGKLAAMGEIAASVVHEISQPLAFINANLQMMISQLQTHPEESDLLLEDLKKTESAARRIGKIISHMSNFGKHEDFDLEHPANINNVIDNALMLLNNKLMHKGVSLKRKIPENLPLVKCNPLKLEQIFINLFQNSIDACKQVDGAISISAGEENKNVVIVFSDNGAGIPAGHKNKIFKAFFTTKENGKGTGLGLLIIKRLVEECGGSVKCDSKGEGKGAKFTIKLPAV